MDCIKCAFILNKTKHLECCNFNQFDKFQDFVVENGIGKNLTPNLNETIKLILFPQNCFRLMQHDNPEKKN
jgi:hypothetical protein